MHKTPASKVGYWQCYVLRSSTQKTQKPVILCISSTAFGKILPVMLLGPGKTAPENWSVSCMYQCVFWEKIKKT